MREIAAGIIAFWFSGIYRFAFASSNYHMAQPSGDYQSKACKVGRACYQYQSAHWHADRSLSLESRLT